MRDEPGHTHAATGATAPTMQLGWHLHTGALAANHDAVKSFPTHVRWADQAACTSTDH